MGGEEKETKGMRYSRKSLFRFPEEMLLCQAPRQKDCGSDRVSEGVITTLEERNIRTRDGGGGYLS